MIRWKIWGTTDRARHFGCFESSQGCLWLQQTNKQTNRLRHLGNINTGWAPYEITKPKGPFKKLQNARILVSNSTQKDRNVACAYTSCISTYSSLKHTGNRQQLHYIESFDSFMSSSCTVIFTHHHASVASLPSTHDRHSWKWLLTWLTFWNRSPPITFHKKFDSHNKRTCCGQVLIEWVP